LPLVASSGAIAPTPMFPRGIKTEILEAGSEIIRIHHQDQGAVWFGPKPGLPPAYRFDAPSQEYRTLYAAAALDGAFVETILHGKSASQIVSLAYVNQRAWTAISVLRPLTLMKLYDEGLFWHRTDARVSAADDYREPRRIALAAFKEMPDLDGVTYRSRHDNGELCHALFNRVRTTDLKPSSGKPFQDHPAELNAMMTKYGAVFDISSPVRHA